MKTKHLCATHLKVWPSVNPRYIEKSLHSFMFATTTSLPKKTHRSEHVGRDSSTDFLQWMGKIVDPNTDKSLPGLQNLKIRSYSPRLTNNFEQRLSSCVQVFCHFFYKKKKSLLRVFAQSQSSHLKSVKIFLHVAREYLKKKRVCYIF